MTTAVSVAVSQLSVSQFSWIYNLFPLGFAAMAFTSLYLLVSRTNVLPGVPERCDCLRNGDRNDHPWLPR